MLELLEVRSERGLLLPLPLFDQTDGYLVKEIEGLDPVDAVLTYSSIASQDDEQEQSSKRVKRNIVIRLGYNPDYIDESVESLRDNLYQYFMPKSLVKLRFYREGKPDVEIQGRVEKMNAPLFAEDPEARISILCAKSSFYGMETLSFGGNTTSGATEVSVDYEGSVETGGIFQILPNRNLGSFTIYNRLPDDSVQSQEFVYPLVAGDILNINSVALSKAARLTRAGATESALRGISPYSQWVNLYPGVNKIRVAAAGAAIPWTFTYANKHGGL